MIIFTLIITLSKTLIHLKLYNTKIISHSFYWLILRYFADSVSHLMLVEAQSLQIKMGHRRIIAYQFMLRPQLTDMLALVARKETHYPL